MNWDEFKAAAPELAGLGEGLFERAGVVLVGTIRKDGSPRISPVEPLITDGELFLGMMWQSLKALDLLRDPRCTIHSAVSDREGAEGEFKLYGRAVDVHDLEVRRRYGDALYQKIGFRPEEPNYHLFSVDIFSAAFFITQGDYRVLMRWKIGEPAREFRQDGDGNLTLVS
jgi:Pyridoxamine 5'-phosphate oxidase